MMFGIYAPDYLSLNKVMLHNAMFESNVYEVNHLGEKPTETFNHPDWEYKRADWNKAQETVGKWIVLFKPND